MIGVRLTDMFPCCWYGGYISSNGVPINNSFCNFYKTYKEAAFACVEKYENNPEQFLESSVNDRGEAIRLSLSNGTVSKENLPK